jgi:hypothetical protein
MMNDDELMTLVREQRAAIPMTTPVDEIFDRGRTLRAKNRMPRVTGALAVAAGAAVAVTAIIHGGHPTPGQGAANTGGQTGSGLATNPRLAAFTVTRQPDGDVKVTIRQLSGAKGLAAALRADGVPAYVGFASPAPATCQGDPTPGIYHYQDDALIINPSAIPSGAGLFFIDVPATGSSYAGFHAIGGREVHVSVVHSSKYCPLS